MMGFQSLIKNLMLHSSHEWDFVHIDERRCDLTGKIIKDDMAYRLRISNSDNSEYIDFCVAKDEFLWVLIKNE